jgi:hypothetical protein
MKRFLPWLLPIVVLLIAIPLLLMGNVTSVAKIAGIAMVILTTVAVRFWVYAANKHRTRGAHVKLTINEHYFLNEQFPYYRTMNGGTRKALEERVGNLLAEISFDRFDHRTVGKEECLAFAVVLGMVVSGLPYKNCTGKIVVFREEGEPEMVFQAEKPVLFIGEALLKQILLRLTDRNQGDVLPSGVAEMLTDFYIRPV